MRDLDFSEELENDQEPSYEDQRQTASVGAWLLRQTRNSKAVLLLEHEATPRDLTAVSATGCEVLPDIQMLLLGKHTQYSSASGAHDYHCDGGKQGDVVDKRLLGLHLTFLFN